MGLFKEFLLIRCGEWTREAKPMARENSQTVEARILWEYRQDKGVAVETELNRDTC